MLYQNSSLERRMPHHHHHKQQQQLLSSTSISCVIAFQTSSGFEQRKQKKLFSVQAHNTICSFHSRLDAILSWRSSRNGILIIGQSLIGVSGGACLMYNVQL